MFNLIIVCFFQGCEMWDNKKRRSD